MIGGGLNLSFRIHSIGCVAGLLFILFATIGLTLPAALGAWYLFGGGAQWEAARQLRRLTAGNPTRDALEAIRNGDHRLLLVAPNARGHPVIAGMNMPPDSHFAPGYRTLPLIRSESLTAEQQQLNDAAIAYAEVYNRVMWANMPASAKIPKNQPVPLGGSPAPTPP